LVSLISSESEGNFSLEKKNQQGIYSDSRVIHRKLSFIDNIDIEESNIPNNSLLFNNNKANNYNENNIKNDEYYIEDKSKKSINNDIGINLDAIKIDFQNNSNIDKSNQNICDEYLETEVNNETKNNNYQQFSNREKEKDNMDMNMNIRNEEFMDYENDYKISNNETYFINKYKEEGLMDIKINNSSSKKIILDSLNKNTINFNDDIFEENNINDSKEINTSVINYDNQNENNDSLIINNNQEDNQLYLENRINDFETCNYEMDKSRGIFNNNQQIYNYHLQNIQEYDLLEKHEATSYSNIPRVDNNNNCLNINTNNLISLENINFNLDNFSPKIIVILMFLIILQTII